METLMNVTSALGGSKEPAPQPTSGGTGGFDLSRLVGAATGAHTSGTMDAGAFRLLASSVLDKHRDAGHVAGQDEDDDDDEDAVTNEIRARDKTVRASDAAVSSRDIGASASLSAIQSVFGGSSSGSGSGSGAKADHKPAAGGEAADPSELMGVAMAHASDLFQSKQAQGLLASGSADEAVQQAGQMVAKMVMKQQLENSGGLGALAAKFM